MRDLRARAACDIRFLNVWSACLSAATESKRNEDLLSPDARQLICGVIVYAGQPRSEAKVVIEVASWIATPHCRQARVCTTDDPVFKQRYKALALEFAQKIGSETGTRLVGPDTDITERSSD